MRRLSHIILFFLVFAPVFMSCEKRDLPASRHSGKVVNGIGDNKVSDFVFDDEGYVWMMGSDMPYVFKTDGQNIIQYSYDSSDPGSISSNKINDIVLGEDNVIWIATQKGVDRYDRENGCFTHMRLDDTNSYVLSITCSVSGRICIATRRNILEYDRSSQIFLRKLEMPFVAATGEPDIFFDSFGSLWVLFEGRLDCYDERYNVLFSKKDISGKVIYDGLESIWLIEDGKAKTINVRSLVEKDVKESYPVLETSASKSLALLKTGMILMNTDKGCVCIDENRGSVLLPEQATGNLSRAIARFRDGSTALAMGPDGSLWVALNPTGYVCYPPVLGAISPYRGLIQNIMDGHVRNYVQDRNYYWTIHADGVHCYDIAARKEIGTVPVSQYFGGSIPFCISLNSDGKVLISGAPRRSDPFVVIEVNASGKPVLSQVVENPKDGMAAFGSHDDIYYASRGARLSSISKDNDMDFGRGIFNDNACYPSLVRTLFDGTILVCYTDHCPVIFNPRRGEFKVLEVENLRQVYFATSVEDARGNLWLGSTDNGLFVYDVRADKMSHVDVFPAMQVSSMAADGDGNVFVMDGSNNVYMLDIAVDEARRVWTDASDYPLPRQLFTLPDHTVALIGASNYAWFDRESLSSSQMIDSPSHVIISSGKKVLAAFSTESYPSRKAVIRLNRHTEGLNLHIGSINGGARNVSYTYMYDINGFKTGPRESFDNAFIPLYGVTNARNKVKFWIKDNNLGTETLPFTIIIKMNLLWFEIAIPSLILILLIASAILGYIFLIKKREADSERFKREMTERMNMENIDFFANVSHEFRTPLTLIHGAISSLEGGTPEDATKARGVIKRSTDRLLKLVSQMLDFNKLDHGVLKLNVKLEPVTEIFELTKMNFEIGASMKDIDLTLNAPKSLMGWVDRDKIEKILYNLCSNALKYTPPGGAVTIDMSEDEKNVLHVSVSDTGVGIPEEDLDAVFDRFYQTDAAKKAGGTGIGLYYTRALVNLHHGSIGVKVRKTDDGKTVGSVFSFSLPMAESEYSEEEKSVATDKVVSIDRKEMMSEYVEERSASMKVSDKKRKLLIIDDDYEVVYYLKSLFEDTYNVSFRFDAMSGYKMIEETSPDIIICDVMMVDVDGIQLCRMVKDNIAMSHIPFIMLTAKSTMEDQIKSLGVGADAYVVKPFNSEYLQALVKSMLANRDRVREMLGRSTHVPTASKDALSYQDRSFMERMYSSMEESLQNGELDIDSMAETLGVSRSKFYYKLKALTGQTPNEFFTTYKLNYSVKLLKERKYKIAAIADMLGFSSASHFTSLFKKQFGVLPSQYSEPETKTNN